ncbi:MAG: ABC transporter permease, partial [Hyphomicrobiaceae bacterium]
MNARAVAAVAALDHLARNPKASSARSRREAGSPSHATYTRQPAGSRTSHLPRWLAAALDDPSPVVLPLAFGLSLLAFWEFAVWALNYPAAILPAPSVVLAALIEERALLLANVLPTAAVAAGGFLLAVFVGIALSVAMTWSQVAREALYPNIIAFQLVPKVAWAPMFILWLGIGVEARLGFAMFIA